MPVGAKAGIRLEIKMEVVSCRRRDEIYEGRIHALL